MGEQAAQVLIVDSHRGGYLAEPDIEAATLRPLAIPRVLRIDRAEGLIGHIEEADAVISWHHIPLDRSVLTHARRCRAVVRAGVGYDNVDIDFAAQRGIAVANVPDYGTEEVADHTMAMLLTLVRRVRELHQHAQQGGWDWRTIGSVPRLRGATLGIVGFGRIGSAVARRAQAFGLDVAFFDPYVASGVEKAHALRRCETLEALLDRSRFVTLHVPLTVETRGLIGATQLRRMRPDAILINTSRGDVIDQSALIAALLEGRIAQAGLDVLSDEPTVPLALRQSARALLTAHAAFYADESLTELRRSAAAVTLRLLRGEPDRNVVNGVRPAAWKGSS
jgi:D-3-phosphoglycerate dehydrogenase/C-terminal binding protein